MKTRLPRQEFQDALSAITSLTGGRTTNPILSCVKLTAAGDRLELCATDGEAALRLGIAGLAIDEPGDVVVGADRLSSLVREMADAEIGLAVDERHCILRGQTSEFKLYVQSAADFPPVPEFDDEPDFVLDGHTLRRMTGLTLYAAARETSRYAINGVLWDKHGKKLYMVATDGRRLARAGGALSASRSADFEIIVPTKALNVFERVFPASRDGDQPIDVKVTPNQLLLRGQERILSTNLVEGRFPKYDDVIPKESNKRATVNRGEFYAAIRQAALLTTEDSRAVRLCFEKGTLVLTSRSPEQGEARLEVGVTYEGEPLEIGFNPAFLGDALRAIPYEELHIEMHESFRPGVICGPDKTEFLYVLMPVSLSA
ncbi:MAG: DNA polymerase III subunit beta [Phycisphaerae bacterium]|jgi:DNA polymerase-3 subunit beta